MRAAWLITGFAKDESDLNGAPSIINLARDISLSPGINLDIYSFYYPVNKKEYKFFNANVYSFAGKEKISKINKLKIWKDVENKFIEEHKKVKYDIIHSLWSGESGNIASRLSQKLHIPFITHVCGGEVAEIKEISYGNRLKYWQNKFTNKAFNKADKIIVGSDFLIKLIQSEYSKEISDKLIKIPFGVEQTIFFPKYNTFKKDVPSLINIASVVPVKNHILLLEALKSVKDKYPDAELSIYGNDERRNIFKSASKLNLNGAVNMNGFINHNLIPEKLNTSDIFVLSSYYEAQNVSALEAAFCGIPVVGTETGIIPEITDNIVKTNNPYELSEKIIKVLDNLEFEKKKSLNRIEKMISEYSLQSTLAKILKLYESLI